MIIENVIGFGYNTENWEGCRGEVPVPVKSTSQDCRLRPVYHTVTCTFALPVSTANCHNLHHSNEKVNSV